MSTNHPLLAGLVGQHGQLYMTSAKFKHDVDTLAAWLPMWVDAMASAAVEHDQDMGTRIKLAMAHPPGPHMAAFLAEHGISDPAQEGF